MGKQQAYTLPHYEEKIKAGKGTSKVTVTTRFSVIEMRDRSLKQDVKSEELQAQESSEGKDDDIM